MQTVIHVFETIKQQVVYISQQLHFGKLQNHLGRKLVLSLEYILAASLFWKKQGIETKKSVYEILKPNCSYKTLVVNMNRFSNLALVVLTLILKSNRIKQHPIKHTDSTDIPVCLVKNVDSHKTMKDWASLSKNSKGWYYGLKLHLTSDLNRNVLAVKFTSADGNDRETFLELNQDLTGIFVADSGYVSRELEQKFYQENKRILFTKPYRTMKKLMTDWQCWLYNTRLTIELNFRNLKMFFGFITSLPRSVDGYLSNYIYALLAYLIV